MDWTGHGVEAESRDPTARRLVMKLLRAKTKREDINQPMNSRTKASIPTKYGGISELVYCLFVCNMQSLSLVTTGTNGMIQY